MKTHSPSISKREGRSAIFAICTMGRSGATFSSWSTWSGRSVARRRKSYSGSASGAGDGAAHEDLGPYAAAAALARARYTAESQESQEREHIDGHCSGALQLAPARASASRRQSRCALLFRFELALQTLCELMGKDWLWLPTHRPELVVDLQILRESVRRYGGTKTAKSRQPASRGAGASRRECATATVSVVGHTFPTWHISRSLGALTKSSPGPAARTQHQHPAPAHHARVVQDTEALVVGLEA
eukprot:scaffold7544_cov107-Isochrysis_galbana.AAC.2